jgi:hypothetical protein
MFPDLHRVGKFALRSPREQFWAARRVALQKLQVARATLHHYLVRLGWDAAHPGRDRTVYIIGLFGTGRWYVNALILQHIGKRAIYFRDTIRCHAGPTSMIYSGHATMKRPSRGQELPCVTERVLQSSRSGSADVIFVYRHPLDSLLTNWIWWRTYMRDRRMISGISQIYEHVDELCAALDENFVEFQLFAEGNPAFFTALPGPPFLSFAQFVDETTLFLQAASLSLRLEDFSADPHGAFSKIARIVSPGLDLSQVHVGAPRSEPYRHRIVAQKVGKFRAFIEQLDAQTQRQLEQIGYGASAAGNGVTAQPGCARSEADFP